MSTDELQKFIFNQISYIRSLGKSKENQNSEYQRALKEIAEKFESTRTELINAHKVLKDAGLI